MSRAEVRSLRVARPDGAVIAAEVIGSTEHPVVLLVAGGESSMDWWRPEFCDLIAGRGLCVVRYDQRGMGETTLGPPGTRRDGLPVAVDDALAVLDAVGASDAHWVGFSAGGWVAQLAALDHPDRVRALTLVSTTPTMFEYDPDLPGATARMQEMWANPLPEPDWSDPNAVIEYHVDIDRHYAGDEFDEAHDRAIWTDTVRRSPGMHRDEGGADVFEDAPRWRDRLGRDPGADDRGARHRRPDVPDRQRGGAGARHPGGAVRDDPRRWARAAAGGVGCSGRSGDIGTVTSDTERGMLGRMGTVTISFEMTLDGVFDQMEHWFDVEDPELVRHSDELVFGADAVLLGRESYEFFREYWPAQTDDRGFAAHYNALPKYVASTTLSGPLDWNATLIEGDVAEAVRRLRDQYESIISHGYGRLAATLVDAGLVDEIHAGIHPFLVGNAEDRLRTPHPVGLRLLDVQTYESGIIAARYAPA